MRMKFSLRVLLFALVVLGAATTSFAQVRIFVSFAPPPLPVYEQPLCPGDGYIWVPGYWAWDDDFGDYYWVPGTWVLAPEVGFLWTPGYWGWGGDRFLFHEGYWGPHVGFYGGINYGFGYFGLGYEGGRWDDGHFFYNRAVTNVNITNIHNVYNTSVSETMVNRISYNGGNGGINVRPRPEEESAEHERHIAPVAAQTQHMQEARNNPQQRAAVNMGRPAVAATARAGEFKGRDVVPAKEAGAPYTPANRGGNQGRTNNNVTRPNAPVHPHDLAPVERTSLPSTGNPKQDQKYQQQQERMLAKQQTERDKLQQKQEQEHQQLAHQNASEQRKQQVEQRHQQQTQQLQQKHQQQQQQFQQRVQQRSSPRK